MKTLKATPATARAYTCAGMWPPPIKEDYKTRHPHREQRQRRWLPYGLWVCGDGREVLFNRFYRPIWQRMPGMVAEKADQGEWVLWTEQRFLFGDYDAPWSRSCNEAELRASRARVNRALSDFLTGERMTDKLRWKRGHD
jgi:hypothetical protein